MSEWTIRDTAPTVNNKYYRHTGYMVDMVNGLNECLLINSATGFVLPNCVGYAWGRWYEAFGVRPNLSQGDASGWFNYDDGYERSSEPTTGSIICFSGGNYGGHVGVVEEILENGDLRTSNSYYGSAVFRMETVVNDGGIYRRPYSGYTCRGFIIPDGDIPPAPPHPSGNILPIWLLKKIADRRNKCT